MGFKLAKTEQWTKYEGNPIISTKTGAPPGRDDTTAWLGGPDGQTYRMAYGTDQVLQMSHDRCEPRVQWCMNRTTF